jgi:preprotein translocase SecE subunit
MQNLSNRISGAFTFFREVKTEGKRVNWPTREKTIKDTVVVVVFAAAVALLLSVFDYIFQFFLNQFVL